ncbi:MAG: agmatinase [Cyanobacteria bacterium P01_H01_bin.15]
MSDVSAFLGADMNVPLTVANSVILPIPYERTTSYRQGTERGPAALLAASQQVETYDVELKFSPYQQFSIATHSAIANTQIRPVSAEEMLAITAQTVRELLAQQKFIVAIGGEHTITAGLVAAYHSMYPLFTVVQVDAHGDLRHSYDGTIHSHACVMRRIFELGLPSLPVGIRSICQEEADLITAHQIPVCWDHDIARDPHWIQSAIAKITTRQIYLTIDLDGLSPTLIPGVGTPQPGGLGWYDLLVFIKALFQNFEVLGCDLMELCPLSESVVSEFTAAKLLYKILGYRSCFGMQTIASIRHPPLL